MTSDDSPARPEAQGNVYTPRWQARFLAPRFWLVWLALGLLWLLAWAPWPVRAGLGTVLGDLTRLGSAKRRRIARINLAWCFPELDDSARERMLRRHFRYRARSLLDYGILWWRGARRVRRLVRTEGEHYYEKLHGEGRPVILLTGHSLMLDFGAAALTARFRGVGLIKPVKNPVVDWCMQRGRTRFHAELCVRDQGLRPIVRAVRGGAFFYYLPDEDLGDRDSVFAPFFGVQAATLTTLGRLARLCNAVVLPAFTYYVPRTGRYEQHIGPPLEDFPGEDAAVDARRMNEILEQMIRRYPEQYMWTMKRFKTRPDAEANPYD